MTRNRRGLITAAMRRCGHAAMRPCGHAAMQIKTTSADCATVIGAPNSATVQAGENFVRK